MSQNGSLKHPKLEVIPLRRRRPKSMSRFVSPTNNENEARANAPIANEARANEARANAPRANAPRANAISVSTTSLNSNQNLQPTKVITPGPEPKGATKHMEIRTANGVEYVVNVRKKGGKKGGRKTRRNKKRSIKRLRRN